jgi:hypothetical protein
VSEANAAISGARENVAAGRAASLAAAVFLRYANGSKLTRFGALDDLRRH